MSKIAIIMMIYFVVFGLDLYKNYKDIELIFLAIDMNDKIKHYTYNERLILVFLASALWPMQVYYAIKSKLSK